MEVTVECGACRGTGLYRGFAEPEGVAVVCLKCNGKGGHLASVRLFTERQVRQDVHTVRRSAGNFIGTGVGPTGGSVTYQEFLQGKMP